MRVIGPAALAGAAMFLGWSSIQAEDAGPCSRIAHAVPGASEAVGRWIAADDKADLPAYCEVTAFLEPAEGSRIGVVYRLPENWNGRLLGLGGGGWAGNLTLQAASEGLRAGYATAQTDGGHSSTDVWDNGWAANPASVEDFAWRAVHEMTVAGKALIRAYYGRAQARAYFQGCSTGGRMAMMAAQRFPEDYDAISAGAPVYTLQVQTSAILRSNLFSRPGASFTAGQLALVNRAVMRACDADDGLEDGVINDPAACRWDPAELVCQAGAAGESCLSPVQADALRTAYAGIRAADGAWAMLPLSKGGEPGWSPFIATDGAPLAGVNTGGIITLGGPLLGDPNFDFTRFAPDDATRVRASAFARSYEADDPDLSRFIARGGRLLLWHGTNDQAPNYLATGEYVEQAYAADPAARDHVRFFALPGVPHCRGGPGADTIDLLAVLDSWIDGGRAPDWLIARRAEAGITRRLCAWPGVAHYRGTGDPNDPESWECRASAG